MTNEEYIKHVVQTESPNFITQNPRLVHGIMGCVTEAGEMMDNLKRAYFYGNTLDIANLKEEIGDMFWYLAILCDELNVSFDTIQTGNIAKLRTRYRNKFSKDDSDNRNYKKEEKAVEEA